MFFKPKIFFDLAFNNASSTGVGGKDMTVWTLLDDIIGEIDIVEGLNEIEFTFKWNTTTTRLPNIEYFVIAPISE